MKFGSFCFIVIALISKLSGADSTGLPITPLSPNSFFKNQSLRLISSEVFERETEFRYSCQHVQYMIGRYDHVLGQMIDSIQKMDVSSVRDMKRSIESHKVFRRNLVGIREKKLFYTPYEVKISIPNKDLRYAMVLNDFSFEIHDLNSSKYFQISNDSIGYQRAVSYLDLCTESNLKILLLSCLDLTDLNCTAKHQAYTWDSTELVKQWNKDFWSRGER